MGAEDDDQAEIICGERAVTSDRAGLPYGWFSTTYLTCNDNSCCSDAPIAPGAAKKAHNVFNILARSARGPARGRAPPGLRARAPGPGSGPGPRGPGPGPGVPAPGPPAPGPRDAERGTRAPGPGPGARGLGGGTRGPPQASLPVRTYTRWQWRPCAGGACEMGCANGLFSNLFKHSTFVVFALGRGLSGSLRRAPGPRPRSQKFI